MYPEDLDSLLAIAHEIKLKGLTGQTLSELLDEHILFVYITTSNNPGKRELTFQKIW